jgi:hypothetical protein
MRVGTISSEGTSIRLTSMAEEHTTAVVQRFLDALDGDAPAEMTIRALLARAVGRLRMLSANLVHRSYPRLTMPPLNVDADEILSAVVERLLKAMRKIRPGTVREFFALANQHMRWELNDLARRLDEQPSPVELHGEAVPARPLHHCPGPRGLRHGQPAVRGGVRAGDLRCGPIR